MCSFFSCLLFRTGEIYYHPLTDSHEDLIELRGITDLSPLTLSFVRLVVLPPINFSLIEDLDSWVISSSEKPPWFDEALEKGRRAIYGVLMRSLVKDTRGTLVGGSYVLWGDASVTNLISCRVPLMLGNSHITKADHSHLGRVIEHSSIGCTNYSHIEYMGGCANIKNAFHSDFGWVGDSSQIQYLFRSRIGVTSGQAKILETSN